MLECFFVALVVEVRSPDVLVEVRLDGNINVVDWVKRKKVD